ncbi:hypothetical protein MTR67_036927 [Solanum verrucosum]|uniref:Uncharacterized protein n=1 Tax=Solanum verrucosum TaxID=315347 RepID=A0AAF0UCN9_SOLVR|nr:hypothetical protein MTR67_036927 [Solanum verrucosum]
MAEASEVEKLMRIGAVDENTGITNNGKKRVLTKEDVSKNNDKNSASRVLLEEGTTTERFIFSLNRLVVTQSLFEAATQYLLLIGTYSPSCAIVIAHALFTTLYIQMKATKSENYFQSLIERVYLHGIYLRRCS